MTDADNTETVHRRGYRWFYRWLAYSLLFLLVSGVGLTCWILVRRAHYQHQFDMAVDRIRVTGEPLDGAELNAYYHIPAGETDLTPIYLKAIYAIPRFGVDPASQGLPFIGSGSDDIPQPGTPWAELERVKAYLAKYDPAIQLLHDAGQQQGCIRYPFDALSGMFVYGENQQVRFSGRAGRPV